jgi:mannosyltransferase
MDGPSDHPRARPFVVAAVALAVALGVATRLYSRSDLWLDEALSVNIATLGVADLLEALRRDGHPPLYYLLLHGWTRLFGDGDEAVRSLSAVFGVVALPVLWLAARRHAGRTAATAALVLLATSPFAVRYSTEARMYSLVMLLVACGWLAVRVALDRPTPLRLAAVALVAGLLALTHYWAFYLLAAVGLLLVVAWRRGDGRAARVLGGLLAGGLVFLPWLPSFLEQAGSTGTPWGRPERPANVAAITLTDWGGGPYGEAQLLGVGLLLLVVLALFGRRLARHRVELDLRTVPGSRAEVAVVAATLALSVLAGYATSSAFASRYTAIVLPLVLLTAAMGVTVLADGRVQAGVLVVLALAGVLGCVQTVVTQRTQAAELASYVTANGGPDDLVAYCPDQLGPAVTRILGDEPPGTTFPDLGDPRFVDWVDYAERMEAADPDAFAAEVHERAGPGTVWLVWAAEYRTLDDQCEQVVDALLRRRPGGTPVVPSGDQFEHAWLYQFGPVPG